MPIDTLLSSTQIAQRTAAMAHEIATALPCQVHDEGLVLIGPLKGCVVFMTDLLRALSGKVPRLEIDFIGLSSYGSGTESSGTVKLTSEPRDPITGRHLLLVDDIVDTGRTLAFAQAWLTERRPASLRTAVLLDKPARRVVAVPVEHVGFVIEDRFVVGYGTDYAERLRELPFVGIWSPDEA